MPNFGTSSVRGFFLLNAFYWAITKNLDLTLGVDYYAKAGLGLSQEFRYLFRFMEGEVKFYYFNYKQDNVLNTDSTSDYFLKMKHRQNINFLNTRISVDIDRQSDANFLRLFSNNFDSVLTRISRSSVSLSSSFANVKFSMGYMQNDTYYTFSDKSSSVKYLPKISLNWNHQKLWFLPGYFSVDSSYSTISRVGKSYQEDEEKLLTDISSTRMSINPSYSLNLIKLPWLGASLSLSSRNTFYPKSRDPNEKEVVIVDEPLHLGYQLADVSIKGPVFAKIFEFRNSKFKHLIEPKIVFRYTTKVAQEDRDRLIPVDSFDYPSYSFVRFELGTRLLYKSKRDDSSGRPSSPVEILSFTIRQEYYFDAQLANRDRMINGVYPEFSQLENTLRVRPFKNFSFDASLIYNHYRDEFTRSRISLSYNNSKSFISGSFFYDTYINQYAKPDYELNRETIGGKLNLEIPRFPLRFSSNINYDITDGEFRLGSFLLSYDYQCIQIRGELKLFRYSGRVETQFNFGIAFGNLGQVKDFLGIEK